MARVSGAALFKLCRGKEKIIARKRGAKKELEVQFMAEMACSGKDKKTLPIGLKVLDEGKLTFFKSKFHDVLLA